MARTYPRFLLSKASQSKSKGTFIIHTLEPPFIAEPLFNDLRQIIDVNILKVWEEDLLPFVKAGEIAEKEIPKWWKYSGIHDSSDPRDQLISKLSKLDFLRDYHSAFTVEEAQEVIKIVFPTKAKNFYHGSNSYGLKHNFERLSMLFISGLYKNKYCSNDTIKSALINEGFRTKQDSPNSPNIVANICEAEIKIIRKFGYYRVNNMANSEAFDNA